MSRLIVKGLPKRYDENLLRELFSCGGDVTDAKVMRTSDGRSRQFAFVGFRSEAAAQRARQVVNKTYVDSAQVFVEVARPVGDDAIARPWSKYSKGSSRHDAAAAAGATAAGNTCRQGETATASWNAGSREQKGNEKQKKNLAEEADGRQRTDVTVNGDQGYNMFRDAVAKRSRTPMWTDSAVGAKASVRKSLVESRKAGGKGHMLERSHVVFGDDEEEDDEDELYEELPASTARDGTRDAAGTKAEDANGENLKESGEANEEDLGTEKTPVAHDDVDDETYFKSKVRAEISDAEESDVEPPDSEAVESDLSEDSQLSEGETREQGGGAEGNDGEASCDSPGSDVGSGVSKLADEPIVRKAKELEDIDVTETGRLFVRNLAFSVSADDIETLFEQHGAIADVHLVQDPRTKKSRGVAFVLFVVPENAAKAMAALDGKVFFGRLLHVLPGKPRPKADVVGGGETGPGSNTFKETRDAARRESARAGTDAVAFNATFMSTDAVASAMADRYGVGKAAVYGTGDGGDSGSAAVRLAAGEARLQAETSEFFLASGVDLKIAQEASRAVRRKKLSRTAFLVKNLPARTTESELDDIFAKFGHIDRILVPPVGLLAAVVFESENDAKKAYSATAYTRLKDSPLYLEWLPGEAIVGNAPTAIGAKKESKSMEPGTETHVNDGVQKKDGFGRTGDASSILAESVPQKSVFVKNLNFDTRDEALRKHILKTLRKQQHLVSSLRTATVATKPDKKNPSGPRLSYGYGFLEFATERDASSAVKLLQGSSLDGHSLELRMANRGGTAAVADAGAKRQRQAAQRRKPNTKLMVRNIAFEATSRDVRQLFATFGQIKTIRLPRKQDGSHRGFGFVEFVSKNEAIAALEALATSHLYGRHLVIDYAEETVDGVGSLEELQAKAARQIIKRRRVDGGEAGFETGGGGGIEDDDDAQMMDEMYG